MPFLSPARRHLWPSATDIVAVDAEDNPVLAVEVKNEALTPAQEEQFYQRLIKSGEGFSFGMLVTNTEILLYQREAQNHWKQTPLRFPTAEVLSVYEPKFSQKIIYRDYLSTLTDVWLQDIANHWQNEEPPGYKLLQQAGLAQRLSGGMTDIRLELDEPVY